MSVRSTYDLKKSLLRRAFDEGRGSEMIPLILWRTAAMCQSKVSDELREKWKAEEAKNWGDQRRAVKALNLHAISDGEYARFYDNGNAQVSAAEKRTLH